MSNQMKYIAKGLLSNGFNNLKPKTYDIHFDYYKKYF